MRLFDSHCHLTAEAFDPDRDAVIERARRAGVGEIVTVASDPEDAARAVDLCGAVPDLHCTAGLHPHEAARMDADLAAALEAVAGRSEVVAIGETGLDYHYDNAPRATQRETFEAQLDLAARRDLPVVVHSRDADDDTTDAIRRWKGQLRGVLHCFTGGAALLDAALDAGWCVSFSGIATFRRFDDADLVRRVPGDRLLIETDAPYLAPVPERGRRNEPAFLVHTCEAVAAHRGQSARDVAEATRCNARSLYRLDG